MKLRNWAWAISLCLAFGGADLAHAQQQPREKVLRYAFESAETGLDPAQLSDLYSRILTANMFDALYGYDYLARPAKIVPVLAAAMPEISPDFRTYTVRMRKGILFAPDPVFQGKPREVTAYDIVYTFKRIMDPRTKSQLVSGLEEEAIVGLDALRAKAEATGKFDYDTEIEGLRALDRYTVQFKLKEPRPRFLETIADPGILGTVAREVVDAYGDAIMEHPVGTGPFMISEWKRSSKLTFVRNPNYREEYWDAEPPADDPRSQEIYRQMKGKRMPLVDKVVISIIEEPQPRWLSFLNNEQDFNEKLKQNFITQAAPNNKLAPNLAKRGIQMEQVPLPDTTVLFFNMEDPVVGGYTPEKVALRRAFGLAMNNEQEVRLPRRGQAVVAQGFAVPGTRYYDPEFRSELGTFDLARAKALLDMFGYVDKDGDGWRDLPDGSPLVLTLDTLGQADYRELDEVLKKNIDALGVRLRLRIGQWPEEHKAARAGKLQMWQYGSSASSPDSGSALQMAYSKQAGQQNLSRFKNKQFDELYEKQSLMPDGPERGAVIRDATRILAAYMPIKVRVHRIGTDLWQPWLIGYKRHPFAREFWRYVDIDTSKLPK
ncbi:MAG: ABC transporter substrate-binding protein [Ramlibacter sp.]